MGINKLLQVCSPETAGCTSRTVTFLRFTIDLAASYTTIYNKTSHTQHINCTIEMVCFKEANCHGNIFNQEAQLAPGFRTEGERM